MQRARAAVSRAGEIVDRLFEGEARARSIALEHGMLLRRDVIDRPVMEGAIGSVGIVAGDEQTLGPTGMPLHASGGDTFFPSQVQIRRISAQWTMAVLAKVKAMRNLLRCDVRVGISRMRGQALHGRQRDCAGNASIVGAPARITKVFCIAADCCAACRIKTSRNARQLGPLVRARERP